MGFSSLLCLIFSGSGKATNYGCSKIKKEKKGALRFALEMKMMLPGSRDKGAGGIGRV